MSGPPYPPPRKVGDEVWGQVFDWASYALVPSYVGRIVSVDSDGFVVRRRDGSTERLGRTECPLFGSREAMAEHLIEHPFAVPTVNPRVG